MTSEERQAAIAEREMELKQVRKDLAETGKRYDRLALRERHLEHELRGMQRDENEAQIVAAFGVTE